VGTTGRTPPFLLKITAGGIHATLDDCGGDDMAAVTNAHAQLDRAAPPLLTPAPNLDCQARAGGLAMPAQGETTGSANLSDELSLSKGVICPPAGVVPGISVPPISVGVTPVIPPPGTPGGDPGLVPLARGPHQSVASAFKADAIATARIGAIP
jgi:hypothetical protein